MPRFLVPLLPRRSLQLALALCLAVVLGACSGSSSPTASGPGSAPSAVPASGSTAAAATQAPASLPVASGGTASCVGAGTTFCGHITITGGVARDTDFVYSVFVTSCANWLKGNKDDATLLTLPIALVADINTDTVIQHYTGPGTYKVADLAGDLGNFAVVVGHDEFNPDAKTTGAVTLTADGSGNVTARGMQPAGDSNVVQQPVDVMMSWTCYTM